MTIILMILTMLALAAAAVFGRAAWRARAEADERSAARVAALASALGTEPQPGFEPGFGIRDPGSEGARFDRIPDPESRIPETSMFASATTGSGLLTKPAIATVAAAALLIAGGTMLRHDSQPEAAGRTAAATVELVSMRHARDGGTLTVTGLVRNPSTGAAVADVTALVFAFDRRGEFVASGEGAVGVRHAAPLQPGEEAPFSVTLRDLPDVGRYRVSFRTSAGPLRHIDRRAARQLTSVR